MLREVRDGFVMALRRWPVMLSLAVTIAVACVVLSLALVDVLSQVAVLRGAKKLREHHAVIFTAYYPSSADSSVGNNTVNYLMNLIERREAYTAVVFNMGLGDPDFAGGHRTLVLFGDVVPELFPDLQLTDPAPHAARGAKLADQNIDPVSIAGERIPVVKMLPAGATFFDPNVAGLPLDRRIVIRAPTKTLPLLNPTERDEALTRAVLLDPADEVVDKFVSGCAQGGLFLVPHEVSIEQPQRFREIMMSSAMYIVGMLGFIALVFAAFVSSARLTMRQEGRAFKIRQMYGATPMHISLRIGGFLAAVALVPPVVLLSLLLLLLLVAGAPAPGAALWVMAAVILTFAFLWISSVRDVFAQEQIGGRT